MASSKAAPAINAISTPPGSGSLQLEDWNLAFERCKAQLPEKDLKKVMQVTSFEQLKSSINDMHKVYRQKRLSRALNNVTPFLLNLKSFSGSIDIMIQSNPAIAALCWGGIKFALDLSLRMLGVLEKVTDGLTQIGNVLPRMDSYQKLLPPTTHLNRAMLDMYELVVGFCFETIKILRGHPLRNLMRALCDNLDDTLRKRLGEIEMQSRRIESESAIAKLLLDQTRHEELKTLASVGQPPMMTKLPCYVLPFGQNTNFFRRMVELRSCIRTLNAPASAPAARSFVLHGVGGVGKSSIALEIAHKVKVDYQIIIWVAAEDPIKISDAFAEAALKLGLHKEGADVTADRDEVKTFLEHSKDRWLIVFDNVENAVHLKDYLPTSGHGSYILTSRNPGIQHDLNINGTQVESFDSCDGRDFLFDQIPGIDKSDTQICADADWLCTYLGGSALGLKQLGSYVRETNCSIRDLIDSLRDKEQERQILDDKTLVDSLGYAHNLATAWSVSLSGLSTTTSNILLFLSFMDPDKIQDHIVKELRDFCYTSPSAFPDVKDNYQFSQSFRTLTRYGLTHMFKNDNSIAVHRLVQLNTLHLATREAKAQMFNIIIDIFLKKHPQSQANSDTLFRHWNLCAIYSTHILRLDSLIKEWQLRPKSSEGLWILLFNCSRYFLEIGMMAKSLSIIETAEAFCDTSIVEGQLRLCYLHNARGLIALQHQRQEEAQAWFQSTLNIRLENLGELDPNTVAVQGNLALTLLNQRRWKDLIELNERRRDLLANLDSIPLRLKSAIFDLLCLAYNETGQLDKAWDSIEMSASMHKDTLPLYSQLSGYIHYNRGRVLKSKGMLEDALREFLLSYEIRQRILGDHIQTAGSCYRAGDLLDRCGKVERAKELLLESKRMYSNLGLIGTFPLSGAARSAWRLARMEAAEGSEVQTCAYDEEVKQYRERLLLPNGKDLSEEDFNGLLSYGDA